VKTQHGLKTKWAAVELTLYSATVIQADQAGTSFDGRVPEGSCNIVVARLDKGQQVYAVADLVDLRI
jgi:hypothetical protein